MATTSLQIGTEEFPIYEGDKGNSAEENHVKSQLKMKRHGTPTCIARTEERPCLNLPAKRINPKAQKMKDHAIIGKFLGLWPTE